LTISRAGAVSPHGGIAEINPDTAPQSCGLFISYGLSLNSLVHFYAVAAPGVHRYAAILPRVYRERAPTQPEARDANLAISFPVAAIVAAVVEPAAIVPLSGCDSRNDSEGQYSKKVSRTHFCLGWMDASL
jgi:hypothetical protein